MDFGSARVGAGITTVGAAGAAATSVGRTPPLVTGVGDAGTAPAVTAAALPLPAGAAGAAATGGVALPTGLAGAAGDFAGAFATALAGALGTGLAGGALVGLAGLAVLTAGTGFLAIGFLLAGALAAGFFAAGGAFFAADLALALPVLAGAFATLALGAGFFALGGALLAVFVVLPFADALADALAPALAVAFAFFAVANVISSFLLQVKTVSHFDAEQVAFALDRQAGLGEFSAPQTAPSHAELLLSAKPATMNLRLEKPRKSNGNCRTNPKHRYAPFCA